MNESKPKLMFTLLCDDVRQEVGGKFSLMGLFESIYAASFPAIHPRLAILNEWSGGQGSYTATTRLLAPDQKQVIAETSSTFSLAGQTQRHREISIKLNTSFPAPGTYWIEVLLDDERMRLLSLPVQKVTPQTVH